MFTFAFKYNNQLQQEPSNIHVCQIPFKLVARLARCCERQGVNRRARVSVSRFPVTRSRAITPNIFGPWHCVPYNSVIGDSRRVRLPRTFITGARLFLIPAGRIAARLVAIAFQRRCTPALLRARLSFFFLSCLFPAPVPSTPRSRRVHAPTIPLGLKIESGRRGWLTHEIAFRERIRSRTRRNPWTSLFMALQLIPYCARVFCFLRRITLHGSSIVRFNWVVGVKRGDSSWSL